MQVFVWKSYGSLSILEADTVEKLQAIYDNIRTVILDFYDGDVNGMLDIDPHEEALEKEFGGVVKKKKQESYITEADNLPIKYRNKNQDPILHWKNKIDHLLQGFGLDSHETFEYGTGFEEVENPLEEG